MNRRGLQAEDVQQLELVAFRELVQTMSKVAFGIFEDKRDYADNLAGEAWSTHS